MKPIIPGLEKAREDLNPTIGKILAAFKAASIDAVEYEQNMGEADESFFSHHVRYLARRRLRIDGVEAEEECAIEQTANTGICITLPGYLIRVLRDTNSGNLPPAGESERRKRFFAQQTEQLWLDLGEGVDAGVHEPVHIVFLWANNKQKYFTGLHFICPNGETGAPHFTDWLPVPELVGFVFTQQEIPPDEMPPSDLGMTKKDEIKSKQPKAKTGTEPNE
jgi:hypothetical protein